VCKLKNYVDALEREKGIKRGYIKTQIAKHAGVKSTRTVEKWISGEDTPDVFKAQRLAAYLSKLTSQRIKVSDIWYADELVEVVG